MVNFHEVRFPTDVSRGVSGGPERKTDITILASGHEQRNQRWADSRRTYNVGYGIKDIIQLYALIEFFEARRGPLIGFRFKDFSDYNSAIPTTTTTPLDQTIGTGDGTASIFQLIKTYSPSLNPYTRDITKPVANTVSVAIDGLIQTEGTDYIVDTTTGKVTFTAAPSLNSVITAGYEFDVPCRFASDKISYDLTDCDLGKFPDIQIIELKI